MSDHSDSNDLAPNPDVTPALLAGAVAPAQAFVQPQITEVLTGKPGVDWPLAGICFITLMASCVVAVTMATRLGQPLAGGVAIGIFVVVLLTAIRTITKKTECRIRELVSAGYSRDLRTLARDATEPLTGSTTPRGVLTLTRTLALRGRAGETLRLRWQALYPPPIEPLTVPFEPRMLDEADPAFEELRSAVSPIPDQSAPRSAASPRRDDVLGVRRIRRNMLLVGWAVALVITLNMLSFVLQSLARGAVTLGLTLWAAMLILWLILLLYRPARGGWFGTRQWLLAPDGLIVRKARSRDLTSRLHVFNRRSSVLCVHRFGRQQWSVAVADAEASEQTAATDAEVSLLLRAWLSPLGPPPVERLCDLR